MPAVPSIIAPRTGATVRALVSTAARARVSWAAVAATLKTVHTVRYPAANIQVHMALAPSRPPASRAYVKTIGLALGSIMATIITAHIRKQMKKSTSGEGRGAAILAARGPKSAAPIGILIR